MGAHRHYSCFGIESCDPFLALIGIEQHLCESCVSIVECTHDSRRVVSLSSTILLKSTQPHAQTPDRARKRNRENVRTAILRFPDSTPNAVWYVLTVALLLGLIADYHMPYHRHRNYFPSPHEPREYVQKRMLAHAISFLPRIG